MNTPIPPDHDLEAEVRQALQADAERLTPDPALHRILDRAHERSRPRTAWRRRLVPVLAGAVATAGVVAAAVVIFAPSDEPAGPAEPVPCAVEVREGCPVDLALYFARPDVNEIVSTEVKITSTGNVGLDAVRTLLETRSRGQFANIWHGYDAMPPDLDAGPIAEVNDVTHADGRITTDFDRELMSPLASVSGGDPAFAAMSVQQLVLTVQSALRTDDPVLITVDGEQVDEAFNQPLSQPVEADWSLVTGIRPESPEQGATVGSPVTITGMSSTDEGNLLWEITRAGEVVTDGYATGGGFDGYADFAIDVRLEPGDYTVKLWEPNAASPPEAWAAETSVVYLDFTVD